MASLGFPLVAARYALRLQPCCPRRSSKSGVRSGLCPQRAFLSATACVLPSLRSGARLPLCPLVGLRGVWKSLPRQNVPTWGLVFPHYRAVYYSGGGVLAPYGRVAQSAPTSRGPPPRSFVVGGSPAPSSSTPRYARPRHGGRGQGRAVGGYAPAFLSAPPPSLDGGLGAIAPALAGLVHPFALVAPGVMRRSLWSRRITPDAPAVSGCAQPRAGCVLPMVARSPRFGWSAPALLARRGRGLSKSAGGSVRLPSRLAMIWNPSPRPPRPTDEGSL